ncbi:MAG TPA: pilus assembly protein PilP [Steroidobacteraceae bacterium]|nr:pilus assembly protein PilP [Steroidobacteraceae bacterium]
MRDSIKIIVLSVLGLLTLGGISACSTEQDDLEEWIAEVKKRPGGRIEPLPEVKPYETFAYNAVELRSPFSIMSPAGPTGVRPDSKRNREFLEQFSLDTLSMVGTLKLSGRSYGLVQTKDGLVHRVLPGQYMGQNDGKIVTISDSKISLVEIVPDGMGGYMERPAAIGLTD